MAGYMDRLVREQFGEGLCLRNKESVSASMHAQQVVWVCATSPSEAALDLLLAFSCVALLPEGVCDVVPSAAEVAAFTI